MADNSDMKIFVAITFVLIFASLASALFYLLKGTKDDSGMSNAERSKRMATALGFRVAFSVSLFIIILVLYKLGYIQPTGIPITR